jgi:hypothetical protein
MAPTDPTMSSTQRWQPVIDTLHPAPTGSPDWPALADTLQHAHDAGHDVPTVLRDLIRAEPLGADQAAAELRFRLIHALELEMADVDAPAVPDSPQGPPRSRVHARNLPSPPPTTGHEPQGPRP